MTENRQPYALVFGVSVFDICGFTDRNYRCNDSNPGKVKTSFGGVCRNIAECMARVGVNTKFISILGDDETGNRMMEHSDRPDIVEYLIKTFNGNTKFILDPVSAAKAKNIKHLIKYFHTIKPNRYEAEIMCGFEIKNDEDLRKAGKYFIDLGIKNVFITLDEDGIYYNNGIEEGKIKAKEVSVVNVTGAGDSFVAGIANGYMNNTNIVDTVKYAISMSTITISTEETIHPDMSHELVKEYMDKIEWIEVNYNK